MRDYHLAIIPGDGIGPEVIAESAQTLTTLSELHGGFRFDTQQFNWGTERYMQEGALMPSNGLAILERGGFDGILLGPVGDPRVPDHLTLWGLLLPIRQGFDQYVNLRPLRLLPGVRSPLADKQPADIDMVCIRENTEFILKCQGGRGSSQVSFWSWPFPTSRQRDILGEQNGSLGFGGKERMNRWHHRRDLQLSFWLLMGYSLLIGGTVCWAWLSWPAPGWPPNTLPFLVWGGGPVLLSWGVLLMVWLRWKRSF